MLAPTEIRVDFEADAYEVMYRRLPEGAYVDHDVRVGPGVMASIMPELPVPPKGRRRRRSR